MSTVEVRAWQLTTGAPDSPCVAFAHGLEDSWRSWELIAAGLDRDWRLVAIDLPWRPGNDYQWRTRAAGSWLADGLALLGAVPDVLVAHSLGANATLELMCASGSRPGRAALLLCPLYRQPGGRVTWRMFDRSRRAFERHIREGVGLRLRERGRTLPPELLDSMVALALERMGPAAFLAVFDQFVASSDLRLDNVGIPTAVLAAGDDPTLSAAAAAALVERVPGAQLHFQDHYDHFCHVRYAGEIAARVADVVRAVRAGTDLAGERR